MAPLWNCEVCCEDFRDYTSTGIDGSQVCPPCVLKMFDKALTFEHEYPPKWGTPLHPSEFSHIIPQAFVEGYEHKEIEYKTQPDRRIYCRLMVVRVVTEDGSICSTTHEPCGEFIGVRHRMSEPDILVLGRCRKCKNSTCMICEDYSSDPATMLQHICTGKSTANEQRAQAFVGLKRGKEWQSYPNRLCMRRIELSAACNHITCTCGTGFCFICGKEADGDSEHWTRKSGCPRYNHPDDDNAEYDEYEEDDDELTRDGSDDGDNLLEDVRGLFDMGDEPDEVELSLPYMTERAGTPFSFANLDEDEPSVERENMAEDEPLPGMTMPPPVTISWTAAARNGGQAVLPATEETAWEINLEIVYNARLIRVLEGLHRGMLASDRRVVPDTPGPTPINAQDAGAIANAYLEDDLSDAERGTMFGNTDDPAVTMEEADIDHTLWRLHVD